MPLGLGRRIWAIRMMEAQDRILGYHQTPVSLIVLVLSCFWLVFLEFRMKPIFRQSKFEWLN